MKSFLKSKKTIFLLITATFFVSCKDYKKYDLKRFDLNGNVKTVSYIYKEASEKFGKVIEGKIIADSLITLTFNNKGQLTDSTWNNHKYNKKIEYEKDLRKRETYFLNKSVISYKEFLYTAKGKISEITKYNKNKNIVYKKILKKINENSGKFYIYSGNGILCATEELKYDNNGNLIEISLDRYNMIYNYQVDIIYKKINFIYKDDIIITKIEEVEKYKEINVDYDTKEKFRDNITISSNYDKNGNITLSKYTARNDYGPTLFPGSLDIYNEYNNVFHYQSFDKYKNWTKQIVKSNYGIDYILKREISYRK